MKTTFTQGDRDFMYQAQLANEITAEGKDKLEEMWRRINPTYNLCRTCADSISHSFTKLVNLMEKEAGHPIGNTQAVEVELTESFTESELKKMTAREIKLVTYFLADEVIDIDIKYKSRIIKKALILLNK